MGLLATYKEFRNGMAFLLTMFAVGLLLLVSNLVQHPIFQYFNETAVAEIRETQYFYARCKIIYIFKDSDGVEHESFKFLEKRECSRISRSSIKTLNIIYDKDNPEKNDIISKDYNQRYGSKYSYRFIIGGILLMLLSGYKMLQYRKLDANI